MFAKDDELAQVIGDEGGKRFKEDEGMKAPKVIKKDESDEDKKGKVAVGLLKRAGLAVLL